MKTIALLILWVLMMPTQWTIAQQKIANVNLLYLNFTPTFNNKPLNTNTWYVTKQGDSIKIELIKLYISGIELYSHNKSVFKEANSYHLLSTNEPNSFTINIPTTSAKNISHIAFNVGIDSVASMSGALEGDLDPAKGMYWAWQSGYINLKIEGVSPSCATRKHQFEYHIGGFMYPNNALRHTKIKVKRQQKNTIVVDMNMARFFKNINLTTLNSVMIPGKAAMQIADQAIKIFSAQ